MSSQKSTAFGAKRTTPGAAKQSGATLIIALLILLAMTLLGTSSMTTLTMEERMISNLRDENVAFQAAESALAACESDVRERNPQLSEASYFEQGEAEGLGGSGFNFWWDDPAVWTAIGLEMGDSVSTGTDTLGRGGVSAAPICIREHIGLAPDDLSFEARSQRRGAEMYTITAKGFGAELTTESTVQSVVFARYR
ncbi:MAG: PilX N-terminal domain-containing pilus assembly protein [Pseudomonadales bacterium]